MEPRKMEGRKQVEMQKYYAVYLRETDELLASGTSAEVTKQLNLASVNSFYSMVSRTRSGKNNKYEILIEDIEDNWP